MKSLKKIIFVLIFVVVAVGAAFLIMEFSSNISDKNPARVDIEFNIKNFFFSLLRIPVIKNIPLIMDMI